MVDSGLWMVDGGLWMVASGLQMVGCGLLRFRRGGSLQDSTLPAL